MVQLSGAGQAGLHNSDFWSMKAIADQQNSMFCNLANFTNEATYTGGFVNFRVHWGTEYGVEVYVIKALIVYDVTLWKYGENH